MPSPKSKLSARELKRLTAGIQLNESPEQIATALHRPLELIVGEILRLKGPLVKIEQETELEEVEEEKLDEDEEVDIGRELEKSSTWRELKKQFSTNELKYYAEQYVSFMEQFGSDVTPSEKMQVHKAVQYEILMNRNKVQQLKLMEDIEENEALLRRIKKLHFDPNDPLKDEGEQIRLKRDKISDEITICRDELKGSLKTYTELDTKLQALLEDLKATRNQRLSRADKKFSFQDLLKQVLSEKNKEAEGRRAAMMTQAANRSRLELSNVHQYVDGSFDVPLLNADNVYDVHIVHKELTEPENGEDQSGPEKPPENQSG